MKLTKVSNRQKVKITPKNFATQKIVITLAVN